MEKMTKLILFASTIQSALSACTFPTVFQQTTWIDNVMGEVNFTTWELKGWQFKVDADTVSTWEIVDNTQFKYDTTKDDHGYLALRARETFQNGGTTYYSFICLKFYQLSDHSYKYYKLHDVNALAGGERVQTNTTDALINFDDICNVGYTYDEAQYSILIKKGSDPKSTCPNPILGRFDYTVESPGGTKYCEGSEDLWDGCTDNKMIEFNYTTCNTTVAHSAQGRLSCIDSTKVTGETYHQVYVYNMDDTVDNVNTFRISCIRVTEDGKEMSIAPSYCRQGQTPYTFPQENNITLGQKLTTTELSNCRIYPTEKEGDDEGLSTGVKIAIGVGVGVGVLVIIVIAILCYCCICKRRG